MLLLEDPDKLTIVGTVVGVVVAFGIGLGIILWRLHKNKQIGKRIAAEADQNPTKV